MAMSCVLTGPWSTLLMVFLGSFSHRAQFLDRTSTDGGCRHGTQLWAWRMSPILSETGSSFYH